MLQGPVSISSPCGNDGFDEVPILQRLGLRLNQAVKEKKVEVKRRLNFKTGALQHQVNVRGVIFHLIGNDVFAHLPFYSNIVSLTHMIQG